MKKVRVIFLYTLLIVIAFLMLVEMSYFYDLRERKLATRTADLISFEYVEPKVQKERPKPIIFDGLTKEELTEKLNRNLFNELAGKGETFATYTEKTGLDPYLAISIINVETGCKWSCSHLVKACNNIGGLKGAPGCEGGAYAAYENLDVGITSYLDILYNGYWSQGLQTAEAMNPKYAESTAWAGKVNMYYNEIKNN